MYYRWRNLDGGILSSEFHLFRIVGDGVDGSTGIIKDNKLTNFSYSPNGLRVLYKYDSSHLGSLTSAEFNMLFASKNPDLILQYLIKSEYYDGLNSQGI